MIDKYPKCYNKYIIKKKKNIMMNKQNKRKLYIQAHVNKTSPETCKWH